MADVNINTTALLEAVSLGQKIAQPRTGEKVHYALVPAGTELKSLAQFQFPQGVPPDRIVAGVQLRDALSFIRYYAAFSDERSRIFAEPSGPSFLAVMDYHGAGAADLHKPEFLSHKAGFVMVKDERWNIWSGKNEKQFSQVDFAEFIEDNTADILEPSGAHMLEVARDLKASSSGSFESKVTPKNGQIQMKYTENIDGKVGSGDVEIPEFFKLSIPVFYGESPVTISARLRYRISGGTLTFHYKLYRQSEILNDAFNKAVASISEALKTEILIGSPS
jgi:hypothetical protein